MRSDEVTSLDAGREYHEVTIKLWGKGIVSRGKVRGGDVVSTRRFVRANQLILSKIDARSGAIGLVPPELDGAIVSNDFPSFDFRDIKRCDPAFIGWLIRSAPFVDLCKAASEGSTNRVRIKEDRFLEQEIVLPTPTEQQAIVARLEALSSKAQAVVSHLDAVERDAERLLALRFFDAIGQAPRRVMTEVAPAVRRSVEIDESLKYRELGARSFGKGLFVKPDFDGADATWQKPVWIEEGDVVLSNIKAWEGAIAIAKREHDGYIASHRYIACVPDPTSVTAGFLTYYLLSAEGLGQIGLASPGTADRNRTLSVFKLGSIRVPTPSIDLQRAFDRLHEYVVVLKRKHTAIREANAALIPATLERIFQAPDTEHA